MTIIKVEMLEEPLKMQWNVLHGQLVSSLLNILDQIHFKWFVLILLGSFTLFGLVSEVNKKKVK